MSLKYMIIENVNIYISLKAIHTQVFNLLSSICRNVVCFLIYMCLVTHTCHPCPAVHVCFCASTRFFDYCSTIIYLS